MDLHKWELTFQSYLKEMEFKDGGHSLGHFKRVWKIASDISDEETDKLVVLAACYFHDIINYPKNHPDRSNSSLQAAVKAEQILISLSFPVDKIDHVKHCIEAHSFSANIKPETLEAKIVQDADRMEALGAIGLARTFYVAGRMGTELFHEDDPMAKNRELDDKKFALDHFEMKLLRLPDLMQTQKGKAEAKKRAEILIGFLQDLWHELNCE